MSVNNQVTPWARIGQNHDLIIVAGMILIISMMVIPLPTVLLDFLLVVNFGLALLILLITMNVREALEVAIFPTLLLIVTLFRLALNVSTTRHILLHADGGKMIQAFGEFVVGGNLVVGFVVFLILVIIQFIVITKGAERVAEVAARFTLDAMPGKQMSIDADLNAGLIDEKEARERRRKIEREADFHGAMDGASKFIKGDAIAGIIILLVNVIGGFVVGMGQRGFSFQEALQRYTLLTIGDGLVTQIPALLVSTATGIIITRAASEGNLGRDITGQVFSQAKVLGIAAGVMFIFALVPGLPFVPFVFLAGLLGGMGYLIARKDGAVGKQEEAPESTPEPARMVEIEDVRSVMQTDPVELEIGYSLIPLVDAAQGGDLLSRITMIRRQIALEMGIIVPPIRIRDNMQLDAGEYSIKLHGVELARARLQTGHYLAMDSGGVTKPVQGIPTKEPAFGLPALWIEEHQREEAEMAGYTVVDAPSVVATHLTELLRKHAADLVSRQDVKRLIDELKDDHQALIDDLIPDQLTLGELHRVLQGLLREGVPIRNLVLILETLSDGARLTRDPGELVELVRQGLGRQISHLYSDERGVLPAITLDPAVEEEIAQALEQGERGLEISLSPRRMEILLDQIARAVEQAARQGLHPVILCSPQIRRTVRYITERPLPRIPVMSYREVAGDVEVHSVGMVRLPDAS